MLRLSQESIRETLQDKLIKHGVPHAIAKECTALLIENSMDGIYSHGINRFPRIIAYLDEGYIKPANIPTKVAGYGAMEKWDGNLGMGNTNAKFCMDKAIKLARAYGIGCVAIRHTNHWMRGGAYGLQAADAGCIGICWTNTQPNMPAWGGKDRRIGNNPLIFCVPKEGGHVMMDGAMAQFSYGAIESARLAGRQLPVPGGFDSKGEITCDPAEIEKTWRVLPIGYWKGSCISVMLDMVAATLSEGDSVCEIGKLGGDEFNLSQVFIAIDVQRITPGYKTIVQQIVDDIKASERVDEKTEIPYPNEGCYVTRADNLKRGVPVHEAVWETIMAL